MAWAEIRWGRAVWEIPAEKSKSGEATDVVLTSLMLELLERRRRDPAADLVWVFPGPGRTGHLVEAKTAWARILKRAHIKDCRIHDLRRTLGSWQALQGTSLAIIGASLGHQSLQGTHIYARLNANPVRASVLKATEAMLAATQPPAGVLPTLPMKPEDSIASLKSGPSTQRCCDQLHLSILNASEKSESILTREAQRPRVFQFGSH